MASRILKSWKNAGINENLESETIRLRYVEVTRKSGSVEYRLDVNDSGSWDEVEWFSDKYEGFDVAEDFWSQRMTERAGWAAEKAAMDAASI